MKYEFTQHLPFGAGVPRAAASSLEPGRAGWAGACLLDRKGSVGTHLVCLLGQEMLLALRVTPFAFTSAGTARSLTRGWLVPFSLLQSLLIPLLPVLVCRQKTWGVCVCVWFGVWHTVLQVILDLFPETADEDLQ